MKEVLVSVIICTYNRSELVVRALKTVIGQNYQNMEIIVVDDGSSDNTERSVKKLNDRKIIYEKLEHNSGVSVAANVGFSLSSGQFIALLGDDDEWIDEYKIKMQVMALMKDTSLGLVGSFWEEDNGARRIIVKRRLKKNYKEACLYGGIICGSTPLIRRSAWLEVGGFDEKQKRGTDSDLIRRIIHQGYNAAVLEKVTTRVNTGHGGPRMTPTNSISSMQLHIQTIIYNMSKLAPLYKKYPRAHSKYLERLGNAYWKLHKMTRNRSYLNDAKKAFLDSSKVGGIRVTNRAKYIFLSIMGGV